MSRAIQQSSASANRYYRCHRKPGHPYPAGQVPNIGGVKGRDVKKKFPWTEREVEEFFLLVSPRKFECVIPPPQLNSLAAFLRGNGLGGLLGSLQTPVNPANTILGRAGIDEIEEIIGSTDNLGITSKERYENYLARVKQHPFGKWLFREKHFKDAYDLFRKKQRSMKITGYRVERAELKFLYCASLAGLYAKLSERGYQRKDPNSIEIARAILRTKKLQRSLEVGVSVGDSAKDFQLKRLLVELQNNLESVKRKPRSDKTSLGRQFVNFVSGALLTNFNEASPEIVARLASIMGYSPDKTTIDKQIATARKLHSKMKATLSTP